MATKNSPTEPVADREIVVTRLFDAPRELVWEAWTNPAHVAQWWGPNGFSTTIAEMDVRPGGVWRHVMRGPDGAEYPNKSVFIEVVKPERIVFTHSGAKKSGHSAQFQSTWTFLEESGQTRVTMQLLFDTAAERNRVAETFGAVEGGRQTFGRLADYLVKMRTKS